MLHTYFLSFLARSRTWYPLERWHTAPDWVFQFHSRTRPSPGVLHCCRNSRQSVETAHCSALSVHSGRGGHSSRILSLSLVCCRQHPCIGLSAPPESDLFRNMMRNWVHKLSPVENRCKS